MGVTIEEARECVATAAEADGEWKFAREVRAGAWDTRSDIQAALRGDLTFFFSSPMDALKYLQSQGRVDRGKRHSDQCTFYAQLKDPNVIAGTPAPDWAKDGSCRRCAAWRALGFGNPAEIM